MSPTLRFTRGLLTVLIVLNVICAVAFAAILVVSLGFSDWLLERLREDGLDRPAAALTALQATMVIGIATAVVAHPLLARLRGIVSSVAAGEPFAAANAARLRVIALALLAIQLLDLAFGYVSVRYDAATGGALSWSFGLTGWLAVLLLFVLARVFEEGAAMREELEATV